MNRTTIMGGAAAVAVLFVLTLGFLVARSQPPTEDIETISPKVTDIVVKTVATGAVVPRVEVDIKSRVSGVLSDLYVEPGELVEAGHLIAEIRIIPDSASLNNAQTNLRTSRIELDNARRDLDRARSLYDKSAMSTAELQSIERDFQLAEQSFSASVANLQIVKEGATRGSGNVSTEVRSTVDGMVLATDVEEGQSVTETSTFSEGTTIATVADMRDIVFEGNIDESEVGRLREGMALKITVGALDNQTIPGTLEYISPKGVIVDGTVQFAIRAAIQAPEELFIRAGSSANADIVLDRRKQVLAIDERALQFDDDQIFVEIETSTNRYERRQVEVGLSDGLKIEVLKGLSGDEVVKVAG
ncbi:MAG: efflux RND transporter periplasmic adaptor subunit [Myxococcota bacterium]